MARIADIIKYEGDNSTIVWKHPLEDFNSLTQLIVHESQEAIFFMNGQALDLFGPGRYTLDTQNIPMLGKMLNRATKGKTPFHCEVYFINKAVVMGMKWGTDSRVHFVDPLTGIPLEIGASGEINLQVQDSRKLLVKLIGTGKNLSASEQNVAEGVFRHAKSTESNKSLQTFFRSPLMTIVKSHLASTIRDQKINIMEADAHLTEISVELKNKISPIFEDYGISVQQFYVSTLLLPEEDKNYRDIKALISQAYIGVKTEEVRTSVAEAEQKRKIVEQQTEAQLRIIQAQSEAEALRARGLAEAEIMRAKGYSEKDIIEADVQKAYAESMGQFGSNVGSGGSGAGGGVGSDIVSMMANLKVAETMLGKMDNILAKSNTFETSTIPTVDTWTCTCGETKNVKSFCMNCGKPKSTVSRCVSCGAEIATGAKFCPECGVAIKTVCQKCGGQITANAKFCPECGEKL